MVETVVVDVLRQTGARHRSGSASAHCDTNRAWAALQPAGFEATAAVVHRRRPGRGSALALEPYPSAHAPIAGKAGASQVRGAAQVRCERLRAMEDYAHRQ